MKINFLGYDRTQTRLIDLLEQHGADVEQTHEKVTDLSNADATISFGYRHILSAETIGSAPRPILNLHMGYLPYNRGAHPNFWAHYDNTPSGVTIHEIDEGVDTGPICFQRYVNFAEDETTFEKTYARLVDEIEKLFEENLQAILNGTYEARPQRGLGSKHTSDQLPDSVDWTSNIESTLRTLDRDGRVKRDIELIDQIQQVRTRNNVNWMDLLRIALLSSPSETKKVLRRINTDDNTISELFRELGED